jgi:hypothetical protein
MILFGRKDPAIRTKLIWLYGIGIFVRGLIKHIDHYKSLFGNILIRQQVLPGKCPGKFFLTSYFDQSPF